jgi:hypothetical protein
MDTRKHGPQKLAMQRGKFTCGQKNMAETRERPQTAEHNGLSIRSPAGILLG